jgi:hypothetical protein
MKLRRNQYCPIRLLDRSGLVRSGEGRPGENRILHDLPESPATLLT